MNKNGRYFREEDGRCYHPKIYFDIVQLLRFNFKKYVLDLFFAVLYYLFSILFKYHPRIWSDLAGQIKICQKTSQLYVNWEVFQNFNKRFY